MVEEILVVVVQEVNGNIMIITEEIIKRLNRWVSAVNPFGDIDYEDIFPEQKAFVKTLNIKDANFFPDIYYEK